jgi:uncharacterized protein (TIGR03067 family)
MAKKLPQRPNLDHLRRQAKALMSALQAGEAEAVRTIREHLPAAKGMTAEQIRQSGFRLADAQSAIARKTGFASWPQLAQHVEQLRALEGTWSFTHLEVDGKALPPVMAGNSRILIDGDCFRTESPDATYEGIFNINVEAQPHEIDIEFVAGPEAGNCNYGIFKLGGDQFELCLDLNGRPRPTQFATSPGTGHAYERLTRSSPARPASVGRGTPPTRQSAPAEADSAEFSYVECSTLTRLQGEWAAVQLVSDGNELPPMMLAMGLRETKQNQVKVRFGGQVMLDALVRIDDSQDPIHIDYFNRGGQAKGRVQLGIMRWIGDEACILMAAPGQPRPTDFACPPGSGRTLSRWRPRADLGS